MGVSKTSANAYFYMNGRKVQLQENILKSALPLQPSMM